MCDPVKFVPIYEFKLSTKIPGSNVITFYLPMGDQYSILVEALFQLWEEDEGWVLVGFWMSVLLRWYWAK